MRRAGMLGAAVTMSSTGVGCCCPFARAGVIPARHGAAIPLNHGAELVVVNTHGTQVLDIWAFSRGGRP